MKKSSGTGVVFSGIRPASWPVRSLSSSWRPRPARPQAGIPARPVHVDAAAWGAGAGHTGGMARVIAGESRGRRLAVPAGRDTRPTSDRAREGLFGTIVSIVGSLDGRRVLDLYAGSGAVGLEALSRGAGHALLVESDPRAARVIRQNIQALGLPGAVLEAGRVTRVLAKGPGDAGDRYDVVFADPPYALPGAEVTAVLEALAGHGWLAPGALVVLERATRSGPPDWPGGFVCERARRYGEATFWYGLGPGATSTDTGLSWLADERGRRKTSAGERRGAEGVQRVQRVVCPGSFDPVTNGHLDIIARAADVYDEVIVAVLINVTKHSLFTVDARVEMLTAVTTRYANVRIDRFHGLL